MACLIEIFALELGKSTFLMPKKDQKLHIIISGLRNQRREPQDAEDSEKCDRHFCFDSMKTNIEAKEEPEEESDLEEWDSQWDRLG